MLTQLFAIQRAIGEELLADRWHASSIAIAAKPCSAWVLFDPSRQIRVHMRADLGDVMVEASTTHLPGRSLKSPLWTLTIHHAPINALITALRTAPLASGGGTSRDSRAIRRALAETSMRPDRCHLVRALSGTATWLGPGRKAEITWTAPHRTQVGGWQFLTSAVHLDATPNTPATVLAPFIVAVETGSGGSSEHAGHTAK